MEDNHTEKQTKGVVGGEGLASHLKYMKPWTSPFQDFKPFVVVLLTIYKAK
jgi:hypothetical protein